jgi:pyrrolysine biosynthesis protein PylD
VTRLKTLDIAKISAELDQYDKELLVKTGCNLRGIACRSTGVEEKTAQDLIASVKVGVIPMTCGQGVIRGFADTVQQITAHIGFNAFVTRHTDVAGLAEAFEKKSDLIMLSDDDCFVAINVKSRRVVDNADATGKGYVTGLNLMTGGLKGKNVLVIGCGPVGRSAAIGLIRLGVAVSVYDTHRARCDQLAREIRDLMGAEIRIEIELNSALIRYRFVIDASPAADIIDERHITRDTYISAPGMPSGLSMNALATISDRFLHDPLQIGVATMIVEAVKE